MNSLAVKKDDMIRRLINELASLVSARLLLSNKGLSLQVGGWSNKMIIDGQSLNHS